MRLRRHDGPGHDPGIELGPTWYTASAEAKAVREERQRQAEAVVAGDAFVQDMERTFNAFVVPGSVKPPLA